MRALDAARRGVYPYGGVRIPVHSAPAARTAQIEAPLEVRGEVGRLIGAAAASGGAVAPRGGAAAERRGAAPVLRFAFRLGDGGPLTRPVRLRGRAVGIGPPRIRVVARTVAPRRSLAPPDGRPSWRAALRAGARLDPRRLLDVAEDGYLRESRARQYQTLLANPGPTGGRSSARYVFVTAASAPRPAPRAAAGLGALGVVLAVAGTVLAAGAALIAWAHL